MYNLSDDLANRICSNDALANFFSTRQVLLTGGTGFVGTWLLRALDALYKNFGGVGSTTVIARSFRPEQQNLSSENKRLKLLERDIRQLQLKELRGFEVVFHAATPSMSPKSPRADIELSKTIVEGQQSLLQSLTPSYPRFVFVSSGAVYGDSRGRKSSFRESDFVGVDPLKASAYGESKRLAEHRLSLAHDVGEIDLTVARLFAFSGPFLPWDAHFAIGNFIRDAANKRKIIVKSDGLSQRSFMHGSDLAAWLLTIAAKGDSRSAYNVGSSRYLTIAQLANTVNDVLEGCGVEIIGPPRPQEEIDNYTPNIEKPKRELNLVESVTLEESIVASYLWGLKNGWA